MSEFRQTRIGSASMLFAFLIAMALIHGHGRLSRVLWYPWHDCSAALVLLLGAGIAGWCGHVRSTAILPAFVAATYVLFLCEAREIRYGFRNWNLTAFMATFAAAVLSVAAICRFTAVAARSARSVWRARSARCDNLCQKCGYDLRGLADRRCPECGTVFDHAIPNVDAAHPSE